MAVAVTYYKKGHSLIKTNGCPIELVETEILRFKAYKPILLLRRHRFAGVDMRIRIKGGGHTSQIYACNMSEHRKALVTYYQKYVDEQAKKEIKDILIRYHVLSSLTMVRTSNTGIEMVNKTGGSTVDISRGKLKLELR